MATYTEWLDYEMARYLTTLTLEQYTNDFHNPDEVTEDGSLWSLEPTYKRIMKSLSKFLDSNKPKDGYIAVKQKYKRRVADTQEDRSGRRYVNGYGAQAMPHRVKSALVHKYVSDIDMVNAHPTILLYLCRKLNLSCPLLAEYVENREQVLEQHDLTKKDIIMTLFRDDIPKHGWLNLFGKELKLIKNKFYADFHNEDTEHDLFKKILPSKNVKNPKSSVLSLILGKHEDIILELVCKALSKKYGEDAVQTLMYDGLHVKREYVDDDLIELLNETTASYGVRWSVKELTPICVPDDFDLMDSFKIAPEVNAHYAAKDFFELRREDYIKHGSVRYQFNGHIWVRDTKEGYLFRLDFAKTLGEHYGLLYNNAQMRENAIEEVKFFRELLSKIVSGTFQAEAMIHFDTLLFSVTDQNMKFNQNPYTFYFKNCVFDLATGQKCNPTKGHYVTFHTGYDFEAPTDEELKKVTELTERVQPVETHRRLYKYILGSGLVGRTLDRFTTANGSGGNGKSTLHSSMMACVGNYGYNMPPSVLSKEERTGPCPELANIANKRFVLTSEPDERTPINTATLKRMTGGDTISARQLYEGVTEIECYATTVSECNKKQKLAGRMDEAVLRRIIDHPFPTSFVDNPDDYVGDHVFKKDTSYIDSKFAEQHRCALFMLLLPYASTLVNNGWTIAPYIPDDIKQRSAEYLQDSDEFLQWFEDTFEPDEDKMRVMKVKDAFDIYKQTHYTMLSKKQQREHNLKWFREEVKTNMFVRKYYKDRHRPHVNGTQLNLHEVILGWKIKM